MSKEIKKLKEHYSKESKVEFVDELLDQIETFGLGSMLKSDIDALLYHLISTKIDPGVMKNRHDWIEKLRIKPGRLNGVQETASVRFNKLEDTKENWSLVARHLLINGPEIEDKDKGTVSVYVDDAHVRRFLEWYINLTGSTPDFTLNKTQLVVKYAVYLELLDMIVQRTDLDNAKNFKQINEDRSVQTLTKDLNSVSSVIKAWKDHLSGATANEVAENVVKHVSSSVIGFFKEKIGLK